MTAQPISADFPYTPQYMDIHGSRIHCVKEGRGDPIVFLRGNPTSSYLWRNIMPHLHAHGRCIAMELIGMGKSAKPDLEYTFFDHVKYKDCRGAGNACSITPSDIVCPKPRATVQHKDMGVGSHSSVSLPSIQPTCRRTLEV